MRIRRSRRQRFPAPAGRRPATSASCSPGGAPRRVTAWRSALHWNGRRWSRVRTPNPEGTGLNDENVIDGIRCASASDCWAVGTYGTDAGGGVLVNEVLHWNGTKWSVK